MLVRDREKAIAGLAALTRRAGRDRFEYTNTAIVYGERSTYTLHMALLPLSPALDLEIIELKSGRNAVHERFLRDKGEGMQHLAYEVDDFERSIEASRRRASRRSCARRVARRSPSTSTRRR